MSYLPYQEYRILYARFLKKDPLALLATATADPESFLKDKTILDICHGNGLFAHKAIEAGASFVVGIDSSAKMLDTELFPKMEMKPLEHKGFDIGSFKFLMYISEVSKIMNPFFHDKKETLFHAHRFDLIYCRQAVNYWLDESTVSAIYANLAPYGYFIFNTFNTKPSTIPTIKQYQETVDGITRSYCEVSYLIRENTVVHIQTAEGCEPHLTAFEWISPERFKELLEPHFHMVEVKNGPSSIWTCWRKEKVPKVSSVAPNQRDVDAIMAFVGKKIDDVELLIQARGFHTIVFRDGGPLTAMTCDWDTHRVQINTSEDGTIQRIVFG